MIYQQHQIKYYSDSDINVNMKRLLNLYSEKHIVQHSSNDATCSQIHCRHNQSQSHCIKSRYCRSCIYLGDNCNGRKVSYDSKNRVMLSPTKHVTTTLIQETSDLSTKATHLQSFSLSSAQMTPSSPSHSGFLKHYTNNNSTPFTTQLTNVSVFSKCSTNELISSNQTIFNENNCCNSSHYRCNQLNHNHPQYHLYSNPKFHVIDSHVYNTLYQSKILRTHEYRQKQRPSQHQQSQQQSHHNNYCTNKNSFTTNILSYTETDEVLQIGMHKVLVYVKNHRDAWPFMDPVEEDIAPRYYSIIRRYIYLLIMDKKNDYKCYIYSVI